MSLFDMLTGSPWDRHAADDEVLVCEGNGGGDLKEENG